MFDFAFGAARSRKSRTNAKKLLARQAFRLS
jgi:hypothetical protein